MDGFTLAGGAGGAEAAVPPARPWASSLCTRARPTLGGEDIHPPPAASVPRDPARDRTDFAPILQIPLAKPGEAVKSTEKRGWIKRPRSLTIQPFDGGPDAAGAESKNQSRAPVRRGPLGITAVLFGDV
jgi:hypothetical protein